MATCFKQILSLLMAAMLAVTPGCTLEEFDNQQQYEDYGCVMYFMDVGQADCCLIKCDDEYMLVDGGNNDDGDMLCDYLESNGIDSLKYVVATHPHEDHIGGLDDVLYEIGAETVIIPECDHSVPNGENLLDAIDYCGAQTVYAQVGVTYTMGKGSFEILGPVFITDDMNANSVIVRFDYGGVSALFTGDSERYEEETMLGRGLLSDIDILKVGHHGSREASSYNFLRTTMPEYAVVSCGEGNSYGHPHDEAISRLEDSGATIYRTDEMGGVVFSTDGKNIRVNTNEIEMEAPAEEKITDDNTMVSEDADTAYIGNVRSRVFHKEDCGGLPKEANRIYFNTRDEAVGQGYKACGTCKP